MKGIIRMIESVCSVEQWAILSVSDVFKFRTLFGWRTFS
jgi:hypothetical protein